eukprot:259051_1
MTTNMIVDIDMPSHPIHNYPPTMNETQMIYPTNNKSTVQLPQIDFPMIQQQQLQYQQFQQQQLHTPRSSTVFVIDAKGSEQHEMETDIPPPPQMTQPPIPTALPAQDILIPENEQEILKDLEMDTLLYGNESELAPMYVENDSNIADDLTIKIKQEKNIFNSNLVHTQIIHPRRHSAEERASCLIARAFAPCSPEVARFSQRLSALSTNSFSDSFGMQSHNLNVPVAADLTITMQNNFVNYGGNDHEYIPFINEQQKQSMSTIHFYSDNIQNQINTTPQITSKKSSGSSSKGSKRKACVGCHKAKKKCVRKPASDSCVGCVKRKIVCAERRDKRKIVWEDNPDKRAYNTGHRKRDARANKGQITQTELFS